MFFPRKKIQLFIAQQPFPTADSPAAEELDQVTLHLIKLKIMFILFSSISN